MQHYSVALHTSRQLLFLSVCLPIFHEGPYSNFSPCFHITFSISLQLFHLSNAKRDFWDSCAWACCELAGDLHNLLVVLRVSTGKKIIQGGKLLQINTSSKSDNKRIKQGVIQYQEKKIRYIYMSIHTGQFLRQNSLYQILDWGRKGCTVRNSCSRGSEVVTVTWSRSQKQPNGQTP